MFHYITYRTFLTAIWCIVTSAFASQACAQTPIRVRIQNNFSQPVCFVITQINTSAIPIAFKVEQSPEVNDGDSTVTTVTPAGPSTSRYIFACFDTAGFAQIDVSKTRSLGGVVTVDVKLDDKGKLQVSLVYLRKTADGGDVPATENEVTRDQDRAAQE